MNRRKIFGIGFHKTGTTSLGKALDTLGYNHCHGAGPIRKALGDQTMMKLLFDKKYDPILEFASKFDSCNDNPWYLLYKELDRKYPGSKFILTTRNEEDWLDSVCHHFGNTISPFRLWIYGKPDPIGNEELYLSRYRKHNIEVREYFKNRPKDLLELDLTTDNKWESICNFLELEIPEENYPYLNSRDQRK